jgi:alcohol dehydrogenase class IV
LRLQREFTWRDGERTIVFGEEALAAAGATLRDGGWERWDLLTTPRALADAPLDFATGAAAVHEVQPGPVDELAAGLIDHVRRDQLVGLGGGRVIDVAKAIAAVRRARVAAVPTTLSGAEMTAIHRLPRFRSAPAPVRPALAICDPAAMTSLPEAALRASAMNSLAHGADALYTPFANPVATIAALRGARFLAGALDQPRADRDRAALALGSILGAYALDSAGFALHHVVCQTLVRTLRLPHAETNAAMLPRTMEAMQPRAPAAIVALAGALRSDANSIGARIEELGGGRRRLGELGADGGRIDAALDAILARDELRMTPDPPERDELRSLIASAW